MGPSGTRWKGRGEGHAQWPLAKRTAGIEPGLVEELSGEKKVPVTVKPGRDSNMTFSTRTPLAGTSCVEVTRGLSGVRGSSTGVIALRSASATSPCRRCQSARPWSWPRLARRALSRASACSVYVLCSTPLRLWPMPAPAVLHCANSVRGRIATVLGGWAIAAGASSATTSAARLAIRVGLGWRQLRHPPAR